jgi:hypothetical protein
MIRYSLLPIARTESRGMPGKNANLRPFRKGQSGNPHGRPRKGLATAERLRSKLLEDLPEILQGVVKAAKGGDLQAARTVLERVLAPLKPVEVPVELGALSGSLAEQGTAIVQAMAGGLLTPGQTVQLLGALAAQARIVELDDLARRMAELEKRLGNGASYAKP